MKFLKGLSVSLLSLLLFISLLVFGLAFTLNSTVLNPEFAVTQVNKLDISSLAREVIIQQISEQDIGDISEPLDKVITEIEPWIKEQAGLTIIAAYDYLLGKSQDLKVTISLEPVKENLKGTIKEMVLKSPPPEMAGIPPAMIEQNFDQYYQQFSSQIPDSFELDETMLGPEANEYLQQAREGIGYFKIGYKLLIAFMLLLVLGIVLIYHEVKGAARSLGVTFLSYGIIELIGIFVGRYLAIPALYQADLPVYLQGWLTQFANDIIAPLQMFSIGVAVLGAVLLVVSFVYRSREPEAQPEV